VQALRFGHVLVIDEADKAPINVTCVLKTLVESGEMILGDGRRVVPGKMKEKMTSFSLSDSHFAAVITNQVIFLT
jgi:hypothetical protein